MASILTAISIHKLIDKTLAVTHKKNIKNFIKLLALTIVILLIIPTVYFAITHQQSLITRHKLQTQLELVDYINTYSQQRELVFVLGFPGYYFLLDKPSPTHYIWHEKRFTSEKIERVIVNDIMSADVKYILIQNSTKPEKFNILWSYINNNFERETTIGTMDIYRITELRKNI
jgi:hypothetical protein